jgi:hypothetical protein
MLCKDTAYIVALNLNKSYIAKLLKLSRVPEHQFEYYYRKAFSRLNREPTDVAIIAKTMRHMAGKPKYQPKEPKAEMKTEPRKTTCRRFTPDEIEDIKKRYNNRELLKNIASSYDTSMSAISEVAQRSGLPRRKQGAQKF